MSEILQLTPIPARKSIDHVRMATCTGRPRPADPPGNSYDNAFIESCWSSLKYELVYHQRFATRAETRTAIFDYIETLYNRARLHSSPAYLSPSNLNAAETTK